MANISFFIRSEKSNAIIYVQFSESRNSKIKRKTREMVNPENWSVGINKIGEPKKLKSGTAEFLNNHELLKRKLAEIKSFILKKYAERKENDIINGDWLDRIITAYYNNGVEIVELDYIDNYLEHYKTHILPFRKYKGKPIAYRTQQKQETIILKFLEFLKTQKKKRLKVSDYDIAMGNKFVLFLQRQNLNENTIGKYLKYTKTIFKDAKTENIKINDQLQDIKGFTTETPTPYLTENELQEIQSLKLIGDNNLEIARDWLIIGCYTGQRAIDLFRMNSKRIITNNEREFISIIQQKTKTPVSVPISKNVREILEKRNGEFPPVFSSNEESNKTIFNTYLKKICKLAGIDRKEKGRVYDKEEKRYIFGEYPLYETISSHICRRTFATMYYGNIPTAVIMSITGHKTEREFLGYIGVDNSELSEMMYRYWDDLEKEKQEEQTGSKKAGSNI